MNRKLASIQKVSAIRPIPGADAIEAADILGWTVVVKKGEFKVGDLAVYFEIDSWLDSSNPAFETFNERFVNWGTKRGMRLKTIKLRKQLSQGLILAISSFPELTNKVWQEGDDVTEQLKIEKWEHEEERQSNGPNRHFGSGKSFPSFIQKTDQERIQNYMNQLENHKDETFEVTIKLDGSSMTLFHVRPNSKYYDEIAQDILRRQENKLKGWKKLWHKIKTNLGFNNPPSFFDGVCSRNIQLDIQDDNHFSKYAREHDLLKQLENWCYSSGLNVAVQGELIAPSIQGNHEQVKDFEYHVFDVYDIDKQEYMLPAQARRFVANMGWKYVPVLREEAMIVDFGAGADFSDPRKLVDGILSFAEGPGMNQGVKREGVVFKSNKTGFSFKAISNSYLLKKEGK